jgi:arabinofuranosyltransferase
MSTQAKLRPITLEAMENEEPRGILAEKRLFFLAVIGSLLLIAQFTRKYLDFSKYPYEDAAMLMRYAQHLAQTGAIVWNSGASHVDGGTDFLFMLVLAAIVKVGLSVEIAARLTGIVSHVLTVILVYVTITRLHKGSRWLALLSATYLAIGPALPLISAYFGTPFFALFASFTWYFANKLVEEKNSAINSLFFAFSGLLMGLIRPEGVLLATFMLFAVTYMKGFKQSRGVIVTFFATFMLIGGLYFLWRWNYFGYPLPNPFYKKGGGHIYFSSLQESLRAVLQLCGPFLLAFILGLRSKKTLRPTIFLLIPTLGFSCVWILLSGEMNFEGRFQYAILPIVLMSWPTLVRGLFRDLKLPRLKALDTRNQVVLLATISCICLGTLLYQGSVDSQDTYFHDGRYDVAKMLSSYSSKNYTMATTEAGLLPLYSKWRDIDTWGLNDAWIAHHGQITADYLDAYKPELIMFHASFSPLVSVEYRGNSEEWFQTWFPMVMTLKHYAEAHGYILAADFGVSPYDTFYYYVRPAFPDSAEIVQKIRHIPYYSSITGEICINYAQFSANQ